MNQRSFPIAIVRKACNSFLREQTDRMKELQEPHIQKEMKGGWFQKPKTREQAIESLYSDLWSDYNMLKFNYNWHTQKINELKALCKPVISPTDVVLLDSETGYILKKYL